MLRRHPGFSLLTTAALGAGIGAAALCSTWCIRCSCGSAVADRSRGVDYTSAPNATAPRCLPDSRTTGAAPAPCASLPCSPTGPEPYRRGPAERLEVYSGGELLSGCSAPCRCAAERSAGDEQARDAVVLTYGLWQRVLAARRVLRRATGFPEWRVVHRVGILPRGFLFPFLARGAGRGRCRCSRISTLAARRELPAGAGAPRTRFAISQAHASSMASRSGSSGSSRRELAQDRRQPVPLHVEIVRDYQQMLWTLLAAVACCWRSDAETANLSSCAGCPAAELAVRLRLAPRARASSGSSRWRPCRLALARR